MSKKQPNILIIMADQLAAPALPVYGNPVTKTPNIDSLSEDGVVFTSAYCNNPLCAPSRFSLMTGQLTSRNGAYDNAAEMAADIPTFAHYLRNMGYRTCLSGKMHFVGADQLHGFEERVTTDIYPADHGWTPDWEHPEHRFDWWYHNMSSVVEAGPCERTNQIDFDDETAFKAVRKIYDMARDKDKRPFCLTVSFSDPHDPYACPQEHWDRYNQDEINLPSVDNIPYEQLDPHSQRLRHCYMTHEYSKDDVKNARRAYYGQISYVDDKIGSVLKALDDSGLREDTIIIFTADHGDMLGEKGLWYKMSLFEWSARVPFIVNFPSRFESGHINQHVSLVDLLPTLLDLAGQEYRPEQVAPLDGQSLVPLMQGLEDLSQRVVVSEFLGEGAIAPCFMLRRGKYKYIYSEPDPAQLYDLEADPQELHNLSGNSDYQQVEDNFYQYLIKGWDIKKIKQDVLDSQKRRHMVFKSHMQGKHTPWDFQPCEDASQLYMRNHLDLNDVESLCRIPSKKDN